MPNVSAESAVTRAADHLIRHADHLISYAGELTGQSDHFINRTQAKYAA